MPRFLDLIAPLCEDEFFEAFYGRKFYIGKVGEDDLRTLFGWRELNRVLDRMTVENRGKLRLARGRTADEDPDDIWLPNGNLASQEVARKVRAGYTFIFNSLQLYADELKCLGEDMEDVFREEVNFNCYVSMRPQVGFGMHWDDHDVFALQLEGRKYWVIHDFTEASPIDRRNGSAMPVGGAPLWEGYLSAGECLYLPRGMWHSAVSTGSPSMHITCGVNGHKPLDILSWILACAKDCPELRRNFFPPNMSGEEKRQLAVEIGTWLSESVGASIVDRYWSDRQMHRAPRQAAAFPDSIVVEEEAFLDYDLHYFGPSDPEVWESEMGYKAVVGGQEISLARGLLNVFIQLTAKRRLAGRELRAIAMNDVSNDQILAFVDDLEKSGAAGRRKIVAHTN